MNVQEMENVKAWNWMKIMESALSDVGFRIRKRRNQKPRKEVNGESEQEYDITDAHDPTTKFSKYTHQRPLVVQ